MNTASASPPALSVNTPPAVKSSAAPVLYTPGKKVAEGGGLAHEGEDIEVFELAFDAALGMIESGEINDAKTILMLQALALRLAKSGQSF